jgi:hypothetical protein
MERDREILRKKPSKGSLQERRRSGPLDPEERMEEINLFRVKALQENTKDEILKSLKLE